MKRYLDRIGYKPTKIQGTKVEALALDEIVKWRGRTGRLAINFSKPAGADAQENLKEGFFDKTSHNKTNTATSNIVLSFLFITASFFLSRSRWETAGLSVAYYNSQLGH